jgi:rare lipoprotein A
MKLLIALSIAASSLVLSQTLYAQNSAGSPAAAPAATATPAPKAPAAAAPATPSAATTPAASKPASSGDANAAGGKAVYYSDKFNGRKTYSGERFSNKAMVAAHRTLPMGTMVRVVNLKNKKSVTVKIIDRGPSQPDRVIDLSKAAATKLGFVKAGSTDVSLQVVGKAKAAKGAKTMKKAKPSSTGKASKSK